MDNNIDDLFDQLDHLETVKPDEDFLEKLENRALSFTELRLRYGNKMIVGFIILLATIIILNAININYQNSNNSEEQSQKNEYDLIPANTVTYE